MRRSVILSVLLALILATGCQEKKGNVFFIMFESAPNLFENGVYANGVGIGEIVEKTTAGNGVTRLAIVLKGESRDMLKDSSAFYVSTGRLVHISLAGFGNPVEPGAKMMGFSSRMGVGWFKTKNLMTQTSRAATKRAQELFDAFEASYKGQ